MLSIVDIGCIALVFIVLNFYTGRSVGWFSSLFQQLHLHEQSLLPGSFLIIIFILKSVSGYFISKAQFRYISDISTKLAGKNLLLYLEGAYEDHVNIDSAVWLRKICFQPMEFSQYVLSNTQQVINESILIIITVTALALYNIKILLIVSLVLLPAVFILSHITKKRLKATRQNIKSTNEQTLQYLNEAISGFVESNIYNANDFFNKRYAKSQFILNRFIADMLVTQAIPNRFFEAFAVLGLFILMAAFRFGSDEGNATIFVLGAFVAAAYKIIPGISKIINFTGQIRTYLFTSKELAKQNRFIQQQNISSFSEEIKKIEINNVSFSYNDNVVFKNINCIILKNSLTGLSGNSGKGKTTLIDILLGFLSPQNGYVLFNEKKMHSNEIKGLWTQFAYVKQTAFLVHDTILNNIILYKENVDERKLDHILEVTGLKEWINQLPDAVQTIITENGKNISGGQRQRIAIARALYKDAPIIILDEPFNELDEPSEISLLQYFKTLSQNGKTVLLVTHNADSLKICDNIIYLNEQS